MELLPFCSGFAVSLLHHSPGMQPLTKQNAMLSDSQQKGKSFLGSKPKMLPLLERLQFSQKYKVTGN